MDCSMQGLPVDQQLPVHSNSCPLSRWCHPTISSSVVPFSSHLQSFPVSGSFKWVNSSYQVARVLEFQHQPFQWISSVQFISVTQSCPILCGPMNHSKPGLPVHHQLLEFTQTHVHRVGDAIQPSPSLSTPSPPAPDPGQNPSLFQWVNSSHEAAKVLEFQLQHQSFQWTPRTGLLYDGLVGSPCSPRDSQESSTTPQFKIIHSSALSFLHSPTLTSIHDHWENHSLD